jgi:hypothetical protein
MNLIDFAYQVIDLHEKNIALAQENELLRQENDMHRRDLDASLKSGEKQMAGWLQLLSSDRVKFVPTEKAVTP